MFVGASFIYGLLGNPALLPKLNELEAFLQKVEIDSAEEDRLKKAKKSGPAGAAAEAAVAPAPVAAAEAAASSSKPKQLVRVKDVVTISSKDKKGKKVTEKISGLAEFVVFAYEGHQSKVVEWFAQQGFTVSE